MHECSECGVTARQSSRLCILCFDQKYGVETFHALPPCLMDIVISYWGLCPDEFTTVDVLRFVLPCCSLANAIDVFLYQLHQNESCQLDILSLIIDRFCYASDFWNILKLNAKVDPYELILPKSLDVAKILAQLYPIRVGIVLLRIALAQSTDDTMVWLLTKVNLNLLSNCDITLAGNVLKWNSIRVLNQLINIGYFANQSNVDAMLESMTHNNSTPISYFTIVWNLQDDTCYRDDKHRHLFEAALRFERVSILDFFAVQANFQIAKRMIPDVIEYTNGASHRLVPWLIRHQLVTNDWMQNYNIKFHWFVLLSLLKGGALAFLSNEERNAFILDHRLLVQLANLTDKAAFYDILRTMNDLGSQDQLQDLVLALTTHWPLCDFLKLTDFPIIKQRLTFAILRRTNPNFLPMLFDKRSSVLHLKQFQSWQDCDGHTLQEHDVTAGYNTLYHTARTTRDTSLLSWIASFCKSMTLSNDISPDVLSDDSPEDHYTDDEGDEGDDEGDDDGGNYSDDVFEGDSTDESPDSIDELFENHNISHKKAKI